MITLKIPTTWICCLSAIPYQFTTQKQTQSQISETYIPKQQIHKYQKAILYTVYKDYLIPLRPTQVTRLNIYLMNHQPQFYNKMGLLQIKYKVRSMSDAQKNVYLARMHQYNQLMMSKSKKYDVFYRIIDRLPHYYNLLLAKAQLVEIPTQQLIEPIQEQKAIQIEQKLQQEEKKSEEHGTLWTKKLTDRQIFSKLETIHPLVKYAAYQQCQQIHSRKLKRNRQLSKFVYRIPYLYFQHPYELYLIDQHKRDIKSLDTQQYYLTFQQKSTYDNKFSDLKQSERQHYESMAQAMIEEYEAKIMQISHKSGISQAKLKYLIKNQFSLPTHKFYSKIE